VRAHPTAAAAAAPAAAAAAAAAAAEQQQVRTSDHCSADDHSLLTAQSFENDIDRDGKTDTVEVTLTMPLDRGETVQHASAMLFFDYQLGDGMSVDMEGVVFVDGSSPISGQSMWVGGDLRLRQLKPIAYRATVDVYSESVLVGAPCTPSTPEDTSAFALLTTTCFERRAGHAVSAARGLAVHIFAELVQHTQSDDICRQRAAGVDCRARWLRGCEAAVHHHRAIAHRKPTSPSLYPAVSARHVGGGTDIWSVHVCVRVCVPACLPACVFKAGGARAVPAWVLGNDQVRLGPVPRYLLRGEVRPLDARGKTRKPAQLCTRPRAC
jgi:hypothetical protein